MYWDVRNQKIKKQSNNESVRSLKLEIAEKGGLNRTRREEKDGCGKKAFEQFLARKIQEAL